mgnify:FL=1
MKIETKLCSCKSGIELQLIDAKIEEDILPLLMRIRKQNLYSSSNEPMFPYNCGIIFIGDDDEQSRKEVEDILKNKYPDYKRIFYKGDLPEIPSFEQSSDSSLTRYIRTLAEEIVRFINIKLQAKPIEGEAHIWHIKDSRLCQIVSEIVQSIADSQDLINFAVYHVSSKDEQELHKQKNLLEHICVSVGDIGGLAEEHKSRILKILYSTYLRTPHFQIKEALRLTKESINQVKVYLEKIERTCELKEREREKLRCIIQRLSKYQQ